jgi:hypothetical protein
VGLPRDCAARHFGHTHRREDFQDWLETDRKFSNRTKDSSLREPFSYPSRDQQWRRHDRTHAAQYSLLEVVIRRHEPEFALLIAATSIWICGDCVHSGIPCAN